MAISKGDNVVVGGVEWHVTRVGAQGVFGHASKHCNEEGCNGLEQCLNGSAEDRIKEQAEVDAAAFVEEFGAGETPAGSDWDSAAWGIVESDVGTEVEVLGSVAAWETYHAHFHAQFLEPVRTQLFGARWFVVPSPGNYGDVARVLSSHKTLAAAHRAARGGGCCVRLGNLRKGARWLRVYEETYPTA